MKHRKIGKSAAEAARDPRSMVMYNRIPEKINIRNFTVQTVIMRNNEGYPMCMTPMIMPTVII